MHVSVSRDKCMTKSLCYKILTKDALLTHKKSWCRKLRLEGWRDFSKNLTLTLRMRGHLKSGGIWLPWSFIIRKRKVSSSGKDRTNTQISLSKKIPAWKGFYTGEFPILEQKNFIYNKNTLTIVNLTFNSAQQSGIIYIFWGTSIDDN